jgi:hypothetical protein
LSPACLILTGEGSDGIGDPTVIGIDPAHHVLGSRLNFYVAGLLCIAGFEERL